MNNSVPLMVSIQCLVYNHEPYLRQCLDGFVMQQTNFHFEAIVHDDASTDGSANIIREYAEKYPNIIKPIFEKENQFSRGKLNECMFKTYKGKYVAFCDGDDYWTNPHKLQLQVDFLENHPEVSLSCCRYIINDHFANTSGISRNIFFEEHDDIDSFIFSREYNYCTEWVTKTLTCVVRRGTLHEDFVKQFKYYRDVHIFYDVLSSGKGVCHSFVGGVYRKSAIGVFGSQSLLNQKKINYQVYREFSRKVDDPILHKMSTYLFTELIYARIWPIPHNVKELCCYVKCMVKKMSKILSRRKY